MKTMLRIARVAGKGATLAGLVIGALTGLLILREVDRSLHELQLQVNQLQRIEAARLLKSHDRAESTISACHPLRGAGPEALP